MRNNTDFIDNDRLHVDIPSLTIDFDNYNYNYNESDSQNKTLSYQEENEIQMEEENDIFNNNEKPKTNERWLTIDQETKEFNFKINQQDEQYNEEQFDATKIEEENPIHNQQKKVNDFFEMMGQHSTHFTSDLHDKFNRYEENESNSNISGISSIVGNYSTNSSHLIQQNSTSRLFRNPNENEFITQKENYRRNSNSLIGTKSSTYINNSNILNQNNQFNKMNKGLETSGSTLLDNSDLYPEINDLQHPISRKEYSEIIKTRTSSNTAFYPTVLHHEFEKEFQKKKSNQKITKNVFDNETVTVDINNNFNDNSNDTSKSTCSKFTTTTKSSDKSFQMNFMENKSFDAIFNCDQQNSQEKCLYKIQNEEIDEKKRNSDISIEMDLEGNQELFGNETQKQSMNEIEEKYNQGFISSQFNYLKNKQMEDKQIECLPTLLEENERQKSEEEMEEENKINENQFDQPLYSNSLLHNTSVMTSSVSLQDQYSKQNENIEKFNENSQNKQINQVTSFEELTNEEKMKQLRIHTPNYIKPFRTINTHESQADSEFKFGKPSEYVWSIHYFSNNDIRINNITYHIYTTTTPNKSLFFIVLPKTLLKGKTIIEVEDEERTLLSNDPPIYSLSSYKILESYPFQSMQLSLKFINQNYIGSVKEIVQKKIENIHNLISVTCSFEETIILNGIILSQRTYKMKDVLFGESAVLVKVETKGYVFIFPNTILHYLVDQFKDTPILMKGIYLRDYFHSVNTSLNPQALPVYRFDCLL